jgi:hypothetical protein
MRKSLSIFTFLSIAAIGSCLKSTAQTQNFQQPDLNYHQVKARANANSSVNINKSIR